MTSMRKHAGFSGLYHKLDIEVRKFTCFSPTKSLLYAVPQQVYPSAFQLASVQAFRGQESGPHNVLLWPLAQLHLHVMLIKP